MEGLLKIREVSQLTGLSVGTLYHMISERRIPVIRISARCVRFRRSDIDGWRAEKLVAPRR
jgi:excisionase family DNA binding protein